MDSSKDRVGFEMVVRNIILVIWDKVYSLRVRLGF